MVPLAHEPGPRRGDHELQRPDQLRPRRRLRRDVRPRRAGATTSEESLAELAEAAGVRRARAPRAHRTAERDLGVREKVDAARELGLDLTVTSLERPRDRQGRRCRGRLRRARDRQVDRVRLPTAIPVVCVTSGAHRVDVERVALLAWRSARSHADEVRAATGYSVGGVPPFGHACRFCSTRRCSARSASGPPAATPTACSRWTRAS